MSIPPRSRFNESHKKQQLLILETSPKVLAFLGQTLEAEYRLHLFSEPEAFLQAASLPTADLVIFAWDSATHSLDTLARFRELQPITPLMILTCSSDMEDYGTFASFDVRSVLVKPFSEGDLRGAIPRVVPKPVESIAPAPEISLNEDHSFVRSSRRMREIEAQAQLVAKSDIPVLILGESGTGKEILALFTHKQSLRSNRIFLKINCAAVPADLLESELFGYEQGAFTGALKTKPGKFETCDGGTIFLDEIGEMPAILQSKLLQVLQDGTFARLGGRTITRTDVRVIAATNINIKEAMQRKLFREDLYYRLNGLSLILPPLRDRLDEVPVFVDYFLRKGVRKHGLQPLAVSPTLLQALCTYHWPGNLRELENVINRFLILRDESSILKELSSPRLSVETTNGVPSSANQDLKAIVKGVKGETESLAISSMLEEHDWNRKIAADALQISYKALLYKIKQYDLAPKPHDHHA